VAVTRYVVDASVVVKWFIREEHSESARSLMGGQGGLIRSPNFLIIEAANALVSNVRQGIIRQEEVSENLELIPNHLELVDSAVLVSRATALALEHGRSVYDCLYLALAIREGCQLVTADERFYNALRDAFVSELLFIADIAP
jgi:predicted nucleic acid-binding protein